MASIRPLQDRVIIKRIEEANRFAAGSSFPTVAKEKPQEGEVIAVGQAKSSTAASASRWTSRRETGCCSASTPAPKSSSTTKSI